MSSKKIKIQIKSICGNVLFEWESVGNTLKKTVEQAVLRNSDLRNSNLRGSDLSYSNLTGSNLRGSDLSYSNLTGSDLRNSDLSSSDLSYSNLTDSNLRGSDLRGSNLTDSNLRGSDLSYSIFDEPIYLSELYNLKLLPPKTKLRMWKWLRYGKTYYKNAKYEVGKTYTEKDYSTDEFAECGEGLNVSTLTWCLRESKGYGNVELLEVEFLVSDIVAIPYWTDGKFRVKKFKTLRKISRDEGIKIMEKISGLGHGTA